MIAMRSLLTLVRVVGVLALALVLYAWMYPAHLGQWLSREAAAPAGVQQAVTPAAATATGPAAAPLAPPATVTAPGNAAAAASVTASVTAPGTAPGNAAPAAPATVSATAPAAVPATAAPAASATASATASASATAAPAATPATTAAAKTPEPVAPLPLVTVPKPPPVSKSQAAVAQWLGTKYRVSPAALEGLIFEADKLSKSYKLSPNLIIAVMAIESNFHPYIQSEAGAQGLMQVMPRIHAKRYEKYGGKSSFIDPVVSLKVGAEILRDCVKLKDGSETEALRFYFGGGAASEAYIDKVRAEQARLNRVAAGARVPVE